jgi:hypothetical protein
MATPSSGTISLTQVQTEFGGSNPIAINEYYKADLGVPTSGAISLNDLRGKTRHATKTEIATFFASPGGVYKRGLNDSGAIGTPVMKHSAQTAGANLGAETYAFTPSAITSTVAANLKNCVENTVVWFFGGDGGGANSAITAHQINGDGITITPTYDTRVTATAPTPNNYAVCQFSVYNTGLTPAVGTSGRLTAITQASCTFPSLGGQNQQIGGAFLLPGKWTATVPYAGFVSSGDSVTLNHGDICLVGWATNNDPDADDPFNVTVNLLLSETAGGVNHILPNFVHARRWFGCTGVLFYTNLSGVTRTYTLPSSLQFSNTHTMYKHYMILKFAPDQYYGQQS